MSPREELLAPLPILRPERVAHLLLLFEHLYTSHLLAQKFHQHVANIFVSITPDTL